MTDFSQQTRTPLVQGIHHLGLTVPDVRATASFFVEVLHYAIVAEKPDYPAIFVSDGVTMLTLWQAQSPVDARPFDRKTAVGLHHFALRVASLDILQDLHERLKACPGVDIEFAPEQLGTTPLQHMICRIPGGPRMELIFAP